MVSAVMGPLLAGTRDAATADLPVAFRSTRRERAVSSPPARRVESSRATRSGRARRSAFSTLAIKSLLTCTSRPSCAWDSPWVVRRPRTRAPKAAIGDASGFSARGICGTWATPLSDATKQNRIHPDVTVAASSWSRLVRDAGSFHADNVVVRMEPLPICADSWFVNGFCGRCAPPA
jgi:hypothetical protein